MSSPPSEIIQHLVNLHRAGDPVRLINHFKGLPISYDANILSIREGVAEFAVHRYQAACMEMQRYAYIRDEGLPLVISSKVVSVDLVRERAVLGVFSYGDRNIGMRSLVRVQPADMVEVEMSLHGRTLRGWLADLSFDGAGIFTGAFFYGPRFFSAGTRVLIKTALPGFDQQIKMSGEITNVITRDEHTFRLGLICHPEGEPKRLISQYITHRQAEIQRELRTMYEALYKLHSQNAP